MEICGSKTSENKSLISFLKTTVRSSFSDFGNFNEVSQWFGFRPFRPNSTPLICQVNKYQNLFLNSGHGSLGWTLSAGSADIIANLMDDKKSEQFAFLEEQEKEIYRV